VPAGTYKLLVRTIGYVPFATTLNVSEADVAIDIALSSSSTQLDTIRVRATGTMILGTVATAEGLHPIRGAVVHVLGAGLTATTDSAGRFAADVKKAGSYMLSVRQHGYVDFMLTVSVSAGKVVETAVLLDSGASRSHPGTEGLLEDFDTRLKWLGANGAVVSASELLRLGSGSTTDLLRNSPSLAKRALRVGSSACVFIDGVPKPGLPLDAVPAEGIEMIEAYTQRGDETSSFEHRWPQGVPCAGDGAQTLGRATKSVVFVSIWLKP
jgi:hypothetical protein